MKIYSLLFIPVNYSYYSFDLKRASSISSASGVMCSKDWGSLRVSNVCLDHHSGFGNIMGSKKK